MLCCDELRNNAGCSASCPQAAVISSPLVYRQVVVMLCEVRVLRKARTVARGGVVKGMPLTGLYGIRFTVHCRFLRRCASSSACSVVSLQPCMRVYSKVISRFVVRE